MGCKGFCIYPKKVNRREGTDTLSKWCSTCQRYIIVEDLHTLVCHCCHLRLRNHSHNKKFK